MELIKNLFSNPDKAEQTPPKRKGMRILVALMLLFAVVSCENSKEPTAPDEENEECVEERKCECDFDDDKFDLSELNEENCSTRWAVEFRLKPQITDCPTEHPEIKALVAKHNVTFKQSYPGFQTPELLLLYTLLGEDCSNLCYVRAVVRAFLAIGLFEYVRFFGPPGHPDIM
jgi:hypothetical protein